MAKMTKKKSMIYYLTRNGIPISKSHSTYQAAVVEAYEKKAVFRTSWSEFLLDGYKIESQNKCLQKKPNQHE